MEFGTYSGLIMDNLPLFTMGLGSSPFSRWRRAHRVLARILGIVFILYALFIFAGEFLCHQRAPRPPGRFPERDSDRSQEGGDQGDAAVGRVSDCLFVAGNLLLPAQRQATPVGSVLSTP